MYLNCHFKVVTAKLISRHFAGFGLFDIHGSQKMNEAHFDNYILFK